MFFKLLDAAAHASSIGRCSDRRLRLPRKRQSRGLNAKSFPRWQGVFVFSHVLNFMVMFKIALATLTQRVVADYI